MTSLTVEKHPLQVLRCSEPSLFVSEEFQKGFFQYLSTRKENAVPHVIFHVLFPFI